LEGHYRQTNKEHHIYVSLINALLIIAYEGMKRTSQLKQEESFAINHLRRA
jgi:hypothetical protein